MNDATMQAAQTATLAERMLSQVYTFLPAQTIPPNALQQQMLTSHLRGMARRSLTGAPSHEDGRSASAAAPHSA